MISNDVNSNIVLTGNTEIDKKVGEFIYTIKALQY